MEVDLTNLRKFARSDTEIQGVIIHPSGRTQCVVHNLSQGGACLECPDNFSQLGEFVLTIAAQRFSRGCKVTWANAGLVGVSFS